MKLQEIPSQLVKEHQAMRDGGVQLFLLIVILVAPYGLGHFLHLDGWLMAVAYFAISLFAHEKISRFLTAYWRCNVRGYVLCLDSRNCTIERRRLRHQSFDSPNIIIPLGGWWTRTQVIKHEVGTGSNMLALYKIKVVDFNTSCKFVRFDLRLHDPYGDRLTRSTEQILNLLGEISKHTTRDYYNTIRVTWRQMLQEEENAPSALTETRQLLEASLGVIDEGAQRIGATVRLSKSKDGKAIRLWLEEQFVLLLKQYKPDNPRLS